MIKTVIVALTGIVVATATPALAEGKPGAEQSTTPTAATAQPTTATASTDRRRYCVVQDMTGSRIPNRTCRTRADWLTHGFDPLAK